MPHTDDTARLLAEARNLLASQPKAVIWKRTIKPYQAHFGQLVRVELTRGLHLRVICPRSGQVLSEGPALEPTPPEAQ
jgi:hypothetical protein